jgi:hypothetical protein
LEARHTPTHLIDIEFAVAIIVQTLELLGDGRQLRGDGRCVLVGVLAAKIGQVSLQRSAQ